MKAKGAFLFVGGGVDKETAKSVVETKYLDLYVAGCKNYDEAEEIARALVAVGCGMIELCAGFGAEGVARIQKAVGPEVAVGVVRFANHPAMKFKTGDELFG